MSTVRPLPNPPASRPAAELSQLDMDYNWVDTTAKVKPRAPDKNVRIAYGELCP